MKRVLMVAFHYPPFWGGSSVHRTLKFSEYLPEEGWKPFVLSAHPAAYPRVEEDPHRTQIPDAVVLRRARGLDVGRHLAIRGRYPRLLALPDRWTSWSLAGLPVGLRMVREYRPHVLWSTYPIASAHLLALMLHKLSGVPWVADFRDSMTEDDYPRDRATRAVFRWIERRTVQSCNKAVFTAPGALRMYAERYPDVPQSRWHVVLNGYDEEAFQRVERREGNRPDGSGPVTLVHSGVLYPSERDPRPLFAALSKLKDRAIESAATLRIILRASRHEEYYRELLARYRIDDIVQLEPAIPHRLALEEMLNADALLILQASNCNHQIPAKLYEYVRARRPILALTDPAGDTARLLSDIGGGAIVRLDSREEIASRLPEFLRALRAGTARVASGVEVARHSRKVRTRELAELLESAASSGPGTSP